MQRIEKLIDPLIIVGLISLLCAGTLYTVSKHYPMGWCVTGHCLIPMPTYLSAVEAGFAIFGALCSFCAVCIMGVIIYKAIRHNRTLYRGKTAQ